MIFLMEIEAIEFMYKYKITPSNVKSLNGRKCICETGIGSALTVLIELCEE